MMPPSSEVSDFRKVLSHAKNIIIVSGAGLSAPSGAFLKRAQLKVSGIRKGLTT
jgi:hypothetical protein